MYISEIIKIERGETDVNFSRLLKIAEYYNMTIVDLLLYNSAKKDTVSKGRFFKL
ncbi:MAG: helix-turn-helix transcriptional regulator [Bacteroidetes bacterium]|nr:helix-turn-helix transcriptional regulator [Bacteroidota bacterium]